MTFPKETESRSAATARKPFLPWSWTPFLLAIACLAVSVLAAAKRHMPPQLVGLAFLVWVGCCIYFFVQMIGRFFKRQWQPGFWAMGRLMASILAMIPTIGLMGFGLAGRLHDSTDEFFTNLRLPPDIEISEPLPARKSMLTDGEPRPPTHTNTSALAPTSALSLYRGMQPGIYDVEAWVNPGEPGKVDLRAYVVTRETRLSESKLTEDSTQRVGWSAKAGEKFLYDSRITIYENAWGSGMTFAARFELWFKPDSGQAERKIAERNFKIEGWPYRNVPF